MSRATQTFANTWGKTRSGSTYWPEIGHQTSPGRSSRRCSPQCCLGCGEPHTVIVIDTSPDLEHDVMKAVLQSTDTLVFVSGITADRSRPVLRAVDYLRAQGYHELVSRSTVILNHTDSITDKDALAYLTERFTKVGAIVEAMPFDPHLAKGGIIDTVHELNKKSRLRLFEITAGLADKYVPDAERAAQ